MLSQFSDSSISVHVLGQPQQETTVTLIRWLKCGSCMVKNSQVENNIEPWPLVSENMLKSLGYCGKSWHDSHISHETAQTFVS